MAPLDAVLTRFLRSVQISDLEALYYFHLAPLSVRRDIALLGMIHRTVLGLGPAQFQEFFVIDRAPRHPRLYRHCRHLVDPCDLRCPDYALHAALGGVKVYNLLPHFIEERLPSPPFNISFKLLFI